VLEINDCLAEGADQAALLERSLARPEVRVVDGDEIRIQELCAEACIGSRPEVGYRVANQSTDREAVGQSVAVEVEQRLDVDVSGNDVCQIEDAARRKSGRALRIPGTRFWFV
jgi:hypothetical protein